MVLGKSWVILLVKERDSPLSSVLLLAIVGSLAVFQQMPFDIMGAPPSLVILPPETADIVEISVAMVVETTGGTGFFSQDKKVKDDRIIPIVLKRFFMLLI
jgi:hypothetical protein